MSYSDDWWKAEEIGRPQGLLSRFRSPASEEEGPPAALLRIPSILSADVPGTRLAQSDPPAETSAEWSRGFSAGTAEHQLGYVLMWKARSVDLRGLFLHFFAPPGGYSQPPNPVDNDERDEDSSSGRRPRRPEDDLVFRLLAKLEVPPDVLLRANGPLEWPENLFRYQLDGIRALCNSRQLLLGDEMGLGKTIQAIAALRIMLHSREIERVLVVAPASLVEQWRREFARWAPELRVMPVVGTAEQRLWRWQYRSHVTLVSYDTLRSDFTNNPVSGPRRKPWDVVVLDEAQRIKNAATDIARTCKRLPRRRSWALTGTPLENSVEDVVSILEFVTGGDDVDSSRISSVSLRSSLAHYQVRRKKADVLQDLPAKLVTNLPLPLTSAQRSAYERAEREGIIALQAEQQLTVQHVLALISRLKQLCNFGPQGASSKMEDLLMRVEELSAGGHKSLVFTQFTNEVSGARRIAAALNCYAPLLYTGDMSPRSRQETVDRFLDEDEHKVLILSLKAGGQGLNLQRASYVFHFDRGWNPAVEAQAEARAHRLGQTEPVNVYRYIMTDTIEERIDETLRNKLDLFEEVVEGASLDISHLLDKQDILRLFGMDGV